MKMYSKQLICILLVAFFILIVNIIIFVKFLQLYPLNSYRDCVINPLWLTNPPLFLRPDDSAVVYPSDDDSSIGFKNGEIIDISCPNGQMFVGGEAADVFQATCEYGTLLRIFDAPTDWNQISSCSNSISTAKYTQNKCNGGEEAVIGFSIDDNRFVNQINVCFEKSNQTTLYTNYDLVPWKSSFQTKPRFPVEDKGFYNVGTNKLFDLYTRKVQRVTINRLIGLPDNDKTYIKDDNNFLSRGHIAAAADFYYPEQINATYRYINMAPQWQCINDKNWNQVEIDTRNYAVSKKITLKVWAGTYGIATLPHANDLKKDVALYLYTNGIQRAIPVPALFWKLLYDSDSKKGIVLIVLNNPYISVSDYNIICSDISNKITWLKWDQTNFKNGYSYACSVDDFRKIVEYAPKLEVNGLLL